MKKSILILAAAMGLMAAAETSVGNTVQDIVVRQQWPWSSQVATTFKIVGLSATEAVDVQLSGIVGGTSIPIPETALRGAWRGLGLGEHTLFFEPADVPLLAQYGTISDFRVQMTSAMSTIKPADPLYMIVDLEKMGADSVTYLSRNDILSGTYGTYETKPAWIKENSTSALTDCLIWTGVTNDVYRTTKLVLRRIPAGTVTMNTHQVTLTADYWIAVFELTQKQYELVTGVTKKGNYPGEKRPVECSYNGIRGTDKGAEWPLGVDVDPESFVGLLRTQTGLPFDLPTNAQWQYACRAGTTATLYSGKDATEANVGELARYAGNCSAGAGGYSTPDTTTTVGSYKPNAWGLFDMYGNVWEWCLDWNWTIHANQTDPKGPERGTQRMVRGGGCVSGAGSCNSSGGSANIPTQEQRLGIRLVVSVESIAD